ncbi:hypothetical protein DFH08DRAFT_1049836 [Mycena albidolilacea]|uniref:Uncharacterized protein n=1 Tax=Mycena albidolilacea TaxID=1033008 RepID=A0AAD6Z7A8_9AGAR|nr:hypothetical protein DFH08DRAFT_1049836 [Mycena albidolilacea]
MPALEYSHWSKRVKPDPDARGGTSSKGHLAALPPRPPKRRHAPPHIPKHLALYGFSLFGRARSEGVDNALHAAPATGRHRWSKRSTGDLLAWAALDAEPTQLTDVSAADVAWRSTAYADTNVETDQRPPRAPQGTHADAAACSRARGGAGYAHRVRGLPRQREWGAPTYRTQGDTSPPFLQLSTPAPGAHLHLQAHAEDDEDAAVDLDGLAYARLAPRGVGGSQSQSCSSGRSSGSGSRASCSPVEEIAHIGMPRPTKSKSKRTTKSKSSATSSTLTSPPPSSASFPHGVRDSGVYADSPAEFGAFTSGTGGVEDDFDGTPGGFSTSNDEAAEGIEEAEVV